MLRSDGIGPQESGLHGAGEPPEPTAPDAPAAPTLVSRTTSAITIQLPALPAGADTLYLLVESSDGMAWNEVSDEAVTPEAELELGGLDSVSRFRFSCHAENEIGDSGPGAELTAFTKPAAPANCVIDQPEVGDPSYTITFDEDDGSSQANVSTRREEFVLGSWNVAANPYVSGTLFANANAYPVRLVTHHPDGPYDDSEPTEVLFTFNGIDDLTSVSLAIGSDGQGTATWDLHPEQAGLDGIVAEYDVNEAGSWNSVSGSPFAAASTGFGPVDLSLNIGDSAQIRARGWNNTGAGDFYGGWALSTVQNWDWDATDLAVVAAQALFPDVLDIDVTWNAHAQASVLDGIRIYHQLDGGGWSLLDTVSGSATWYRHEGAYAVTGTHQYKLVPYDGANDSPTESVSNEVVVS